MKDENIWIHKYLTEKVVTERIKADDAPTLIDELDFVSDDLIQALVMNRKAIAQIKVIKREIKKLQGIV